MLSGAKKKHINSVEDIDFVEFADDITQVPSVSIYVDMQNLKDVLGEEDLSRHLSHGDMSYGLIEFGNRIGRLCNLFVATDNTKDYITKIWQRKGIQPQRPIILGQSNVLITIEVTRSLLTNPTDVYVFVAADSTYADVAKFLVERGKTVILVAPKGAKVNYVRDFCHFTFTLNDIVSISDDLDVEDYDLGDFIRLVKSNMDYLEFVGVQFLIERQMTKKLGIDNIKVCQQIFHKAKEEGVIIMGQRENVGGSSKPVTSCELDMSHPLVIEALEDYTDCRDSSDDDGDYDEDDSTDE